MQASVSWPGCSPLEDVIPMDTYTARVESSGHVLLGTSGHCKVGDFLFCVCLKINMLEKKVLPGWHG